MNITVVLLEMFIDIVFMTYCHFTVLIGTKKVNLIWRQSQNHGEHLNCLHSYINFQ